jgi:hypothetical protein
LARPNYRFQKQQAPGAPGRAEYCNETTLLEERQMTKGMNDHQKNTTKKKPTQSLMEQRAAEAEKRTQKKWARG